MQSLIKNHPIKFQLGGFITVIFFIIATTFSFSDERNEINNNFKTMTNQYEHCLKWYENLDNRVKEQEVKNQEQEIVIMEIRTKLANIESMLIDIKKTLNK